VLFPFQFHPPSRFYIRKRARFESGLVPAKQPSGVVRMRIRAILSPCATDVNECWKRMEFPDIQRMAAFSRLM
jgi:hypothetical protein